MSGRIPDKAQSAIRHGGNLGRARAVFPDAPEPWIDLSTGISPHSYPHSPLPASVFARLPEPHALATLKEVAARSFGAPSPVHLAAAPGTQMLMPLLAQWSAEHGAKRCAVLSPAYAEHARTARMAGLSVTEVSAFKDLHAFDHAVVINPNNPDGHVTSRTELLSLADTMRDKGGLLVVDEAFIETGCGESLAGHAKSPGLVVLRSFGKFYGMAGVRLGFAVAFPELATDLEARLGPWAVSGPALHIATQALADDDWRNAMRARLRLDSERLNELLRKSDLVVVGGTPLFTLVRSERAAEIFGHLARNGILTRIFEERPSDIRFGLPGTEEEWQRLEKVLSSI